MDLTNFISTFEYASTQASRAIGSTNDIKRHIHSMKNLEEHGVGSSMLSMIRKSVGMQSQMHQASQNLIQKNAQTLRTRNISKQINAKIGSSDYDTIEGIKESFRKRTNAPKQNIPTKRYSTFMSANNNHIFDDMIDEAKNKTVKNVLSDTEPIANAASKKAAKTAAKEVAKEVAEDATKKTAKGLLESAKNAKIPQIALGVGVTAWLVNKMSDSRGQQSNGQLYGQGY